MKELVIGKRITVGALITSFASILAHFFPDKMTIIMAMAIPLTFSIQVLIAHYYGITDPNTPIKTTSG